MKIWLVTLLLILLPASGFAQDMSPADQALDQSMQGMMNGMNAPMTGDPDKDFVTMMIPHHQGAVDMCKVELQYGKDAEMRKLCVGIIEAQNKEIAQMKRWQAAH